VAATEAGNPEDDYSTALHMAERQGNRLLELRAATSLANLWKSQGRLADAFALLAPVHDSFKGGLKTPLLKEAAIRLDELRRMLPARGRPLTGSAFGTIRSDN